MHNVNTADKRMCRLHTIKTSEIELKSCQTDCVPWRATQGILPFGRVSFSGEFSTTHVIYITQNGFISTTLLKEQKTPVQEGTSVALQIQVLLTLKSFNENIRKSITITNKNLHTRI